MTAESRGTSEQTVRTSGPTAKMKKMIKHHRGRESLKERFAEELATLETPDEAGPRRAESPGGEGELTHDQQSTIEPKMTKTSRHQGD